MQSAIAAKLGLSKEEVAVSPAGKGICNSAKRRALEESGEQEFDVKFPVSESDVEKTKSMVVSQDFRYAAQQSVQKVATNAVVEKVDASSVLTLADGSESGSGSSDPDDFNETSSPAIFTLLAFGLIASMF